MTASLTNLSTTNWPGWTLATAASAVSAPGAFLTCEAGSTPIVLLRGQDRVLRAFVNMCRHRGMALFLGCGQVASTVACPYHAWRFDTAGRLRVIPQKAQFPGVDPGDWNLLPAKLSEWGGLVFVHEDPAETDLGPSLPDPGGLPSAATFEIAGAFDWQVWEPGPAAAASGATSLLSVEPAGLITVVTSVRGTAPGSSTVRVGITTPDADALPRAALEAREHVTARVRDLESAATHPHSPLREADR